MNTRLGYPYPVCSWRNGVPPTSRGTVYASAAVSEGRVCLLYPACANMSPWADLRESRARSFRSGSVGGCSGSEARPDVAGPGFVGLEPSRFLRRKSGKAIQQFHYRALHSSRAREFRCAGAEHLLISRIPPYFRHSPRVRIRRTHRSILRLCNALRVSFRAV